MKGVEIEIKPKVLAVSSGGGHWIQLLRIRSAFDGCDVTYATVDDGYAADVEDCRFVRIPNGNLWSMWSLMHSAFGVGRLLMKLRPEVVVTTGAAPGLFAVMFGKLVGARTLWLDSMANAGSLSASGRKAMRFSDLCLTQWRHLTGDGGPHFRGAVLNSSALT
ncbi:MAG: UDP-N-acetylglucosamine--LPS N-acetylglucosamine transferase [Verrucomicrobia bacterium]|nr:UDP-N-acetylglucosamine--LPS N-acetylglucosamine transferase [Verrucomicrobiota bacterium]